MGSLRSVLVALPTGIELKHIPQHVALVMDGNGRWAERRGLKRTDGHAAGEEALFDTVEGALTLGLKWMTVYAFSTENWRRPLDEVRYLMNFNERILLNRRDELHEKGVRVRFIGRRGGRVPRRVRQRIEETEALTASNRRLTLTFAFNYGGRAELVVIRRESDIARRVFRPERYRARESLPSATVWNRKVAAPVAMRMMMLRPSCEHAPRASAGLVMATATPMLDAAGMVVTEMRTPTSAAWRAPVSEIAPATPARTATRMAKRSGLLMKLVRGRSPSR